MWPQISYVKLGVSRTESISPQVLQLCPRSLRKYLVSGTILGNTEGDKTERNARFHGAFIPLVETDSMAKTICDATDGRRNEDNSNIERTGL